MYEQTIIHLLIKSGIILCGLIAVSLAVPWLPSVTLVLAFVAGQSEDISIDGGTISQCCKRFLFSEESRLDLGPTQLDA